MFSQACVKNSVHGGCLSRGCVSQHTFGQTPPSKHTPYLPRHTPPRADTPSPTLRDTVNKRAVRILLECILVKLLLWQSKMRWKYIWCSSITGSREVLKPCSERESTRASIDALKWVRDPFSIVNTSITADAPCECYRYESMEFVPIVDAYAAAEARCE